MQVENALCGLGHSYSYKISEGHKMHIKHWMKSEKKKLTLTLKTSFGLYYQNILFKECSFYQRVNKKI